MKKVLLINAHQFYEGIFPGRLNKTMTGIPKEKNGETRIRSQVNIH